MDDEAAFSISAVAAVEDDLRRSLYGYIRRAQHAVSRDEAAAAAGISRKLAAFHLDKLVAAGLLRARFEAVEGRRKAGRTPKVYEPTNADVRVSIPPRQHDLLASILLEAVAHVGEHETAQQAARRTAHDRGHAIGAAEREQARLGRLGAERALTTTAGALARYGFEPARDGPACLRLRNCPFHPMAAESPELVCGLNHAFCEGFLDGLQARTVQARLVPREGECCVEIRGT